MRLKGQVLLETRPAKQLAPTLLGVKIQGSKAFLYSTIYEADKENKKSIEERLLKKSTGKITKKASQARPTILVPLNRRT